MCLHNMVNFSPLTAEIICWLWGTPANFNGLRVLAWLLHRSLSGGQPNFAWCLDVSWAGTLYVRFWGLLPPKGILPYAIFTLGPSLVFSYIGGITALQSSSGWQPNFAALSRGCHLYSAGRPSRWASAHIPVLSVVQWLLLDFKFISTNNCFFPTMTTTSPQNLTRHTASTQYKRSTTFRVRRYVLIAKKNPRTNCKSNQWCTTSGHPLPFPQVTSGSM